MLETCHGVLHHLGQAGDVQQIGLHQRHRIGAPGIEFVLERIGLGLGRAVVQHQARASGMQTACNHRAHALGTTGNQHHLVLHIVLHPRMIPDALLPA